MNLTKSVSFRPYQTAAINTAVSEARRGRRRVVLCLPTGAGKSVVMGELARMARGRTLVIVPGLVLFDQMHQTLEKFLGAKVEKEQGENRASRNPIFRTKTTLAMRHSLISNDRYKSDAFDDITCVIVDECHVGITPAFERVLRYYEERGACVFGLSATPYRGKGRALAYWDRPAYVYSLRSAIEDGYLVRPVAHLHEVTALDFSVVDAFREEWEDTNALNAVLAAEQFCQEVAQMVVQTYRQQQSVVYAANKPQVALITDILSRYGCKVASVYSQQTREDRDANITAFRKGDAKIIVNCNVLTFGWDVPELRNVYMAAPTHSLSRYEQRLGRVLRTLTGTLQPGMTAEERRAAIAASPKPVATVHDITPTSGEIELLTAYEVLDAMVKKGKRRGGRPKTSPAEGYDVLAAIEQRDIEDEIRRLERLADVQEKRRKVIVGAMIESTERDLLDSPGKKPQKKARGWRMLWGPYQGELIRELPTGYLDGVVKRSRKVTPLIAGIQKELAYRETQNK